MFVKSIIIAFALIFLSVPVHSGQFIANIGSVHTAHTQKSSGDNRTYRSFNPGLSYETDSQIESGFFLNSHEQLSLYVLKRQPLIEEREINFSYGLITGYNDSVFPFVTLNKDVFERFRVSATVAPITKNDLSEGFQLVLALQLKL